jgi:hypothetical protein
MVRRFILLNLSFVFLFAKAQTVDGIWKGKLTQSTGGCFPEYNIEMQINIKGTKITGASYHYSDIYNYVKEEFEGGYDGVNRSMVINEIKLVTFHIPPDCIPCIKKYNLIYNKNGADETLTGDWGGIMMNNLGACPPGKIILTRARETAFKNEDKKKSFSSTFTNREKELVKEIKVDTGTVRLDFYDNGIIDGDTISVYVNKIPVVVNKMLTEKPITMYVKIDLNKTQQEVVMVGENMGAIPPNTALMIITAGDKKYQLFLTSTEQKNAMVRFIYEKPK